MYITFKIAVSGSQKKLRLYNKHQSVNDVHGNIGP